MLMIWESCEIFLSGLLESLRCEALAGRFQLTSLHVEHWLRFQLTDPSNAWKTRKVEAIVNSVRRSPNLELTIHEGTRASTTAVS